MFSLLHRLRPRHAVCLLGAFVIASGCVANGSNDGGGATQMMEAGVGGTTVTFIDSGFPVDAQTLGDSGPGLDPRCGTTNYCHGTPDQAEACEGHGMDAGGPVRHGDAGSRHVDASLSGRDASAVLDGGADGGDASPREHDGGVHLLSLPIPEPLPPPPDAGEQRYSCQVARDNSGGPVHQCLPSGALGNGKPCNSASECAAGLACVGPTSPGLCLQYCCDPSRDCGDGNFCADRPLIEEGNPKKPLIVPVCAHGDDCALLEPFPCTGANCTCTDPTTTCTVVRSDGTRGCVTPGNGKVNDRCSRSGPACAAGYYCSLATSRCVKICKTDNIDDRCSPGKCQAAAGFPPGFGLCVGYTPSMQ